MEKLKELNDYPLIPMNDIDPIAREIAVRWHENATDWVGDKHKLASDIMNYSKNRIAEISTHHQQEDWIRVEDKLPEVSEKFGESEYLLCIAKNGNQFFGWYNSKMEEWYVAHYLATTVALSYDHVPTHWRPLPVPPKQ